MANKPGLPCVEVPKCSYQNNHQVLKKRGGVEWSMENFATIPITQLSTGAGKGKSLTEVHLCFDETNLYLNVDLHNQFYLTNEQQFKTCNDAIFNENVFETFIVPYQETEPHCYNELDISPNNVMFEAGIYNPNLNHTGIVGTDMSCDASGILHNTVINSDLSWKAALSYPFHLLNCPYNCPVGNYCGRDLPNDIYRLNFYRINELSPVSKCSSSTCEYLAWNPTLANPPAFHEPTKFGYMLLQFESK
jgi:hypothetical protein